MKKLYSFALATAVSLTAFANTNVTKIADAEKVAADFKFRTAVESTELEHPSKTAKAVDYDNVKWNSIGQGKYVASIIPSYYANATTDPVDVEVFEAEGNPGVYKAVGVWPDMVTSGSAYIIVDASNPQCVKVPYTFTGIKDSVDGDTYIASQTWIFSQQGYSDATIVAGVPQILPVYDQANKLISFPAQSLVVRWPNAPANSQYGTEADKYYVGDLEGALVLPGGNYVEPWELIGEATVSGDMFFGLFSATPQSYKVDVYKSTSNPAIIRVKNALKGLMAALGSTAAPDFDFDTTVPANVLLEPTSMQIGNTTEGTYYALTINANYESIDDCPVAQRGSYTETENEVVLTFPAKTFYIWPSKTTSLYSANKDTVTISVKKTSGVEEITDAEIEDAPVEFYTLQGVRVDNPTAGSLVIRRQGSKVEKFIVR